MKPEKILGMLLTGFILIAVVGIIILSIGIFVYSMFEIAGLLTTIFGETTEEGEVILKALKAIDAVLLGVVFFIIGLGLFELFVRPIDNLPEWFKIKNIDELKATLIKVIVVVMGVSFTGRIVTWDGETDLLGYGLGMGAVVLALSYFLQVKIKEKEVEAK
ncbi:MAG: YqhA family protein [Bacteroidota bacterium]